MTHLPERRNETPARTQKSRPPAAPGQVPKVDAAHLYQEFMGQYDKNTFLAYRSDLSSFAQWWSLSPQQAVTRLVSLQRVEANAVARAWRNHMVQEGRAPNSVNRSLAALRSVVKFASQLGLMDWSLEVKGVKTQRYRDTSGPGLETVRKVLKHVDQKEPSTKNLRDAAMIHLLFNLGLRRFEVLGLDMQDVEFDRNRISLMGKGRTEPEYVRLNETATQALQRWVRHRGTDPGPLFISCDPAGKGTGRLSNWGLNYVVRQVGKELGIKGLKPHGFRHTAITEILERTDGNYRVAQQFSRHKKLDTVAIYDDNRLKLRGEGAHLLDEVLEDDADGDEAQS